MLTVSKWKNVPPSAIPMLFAVTPEMYKRAVAQNNFEQRCGEGPILFSLEEIASCREIEKYMEITQRFYPGLQFLGQKVGLISMSTLSLVFSMYEAFAPLIFS